MFKSCLSLILAALVIQSARSEGAFEGGRVQVGCNYWGSHAGVYMWRDWRPQQVEKDLDLMAAQGMTVVRVFPLWPDFQPLSRDCESKGTFVGYLQSDRKLANYAAVDDVMMERFRFLCAAAEKRGLSLIVGLVTGWMSGRMFVPPAFANMNVLTEPEAIMWETRFVRYFIEKTKDSKAIVAWDLGNECNCMGEADAFQMWNWFHAISREIRLADPTRPVVSGLHSVLTQSRARVNFWQMSELMDVLTTHPYPLWTPNCNFEPFDSIRNACHAPCETALYADLGRHVAIVEEAGSLGPSVAAEDVAAATLRMQLFGAWTIGSPMYLWWCAFDQTKFDFPPYERNHVERELGLFTVDGQPKPTALALRAFRDLQASLPFDRLPARRTDAVVLASRRENAWPVLQHAWLLSRQAGFDIRYADAEGELPASDFYILPSGEWLSTYTRSAWLRVVEKARAGATVLVTLGNVSVLSELKELAGVETRRFYTRPRTVDCTVDGLKVSFEEPRTREIVARGADVVLSDASGSPLMTSFPVGKGKVLFFNAALEANAGLCGWPVYRKVARLAGVKRRIESTDDGIRLGLTEHPDGSGRTYVVAVNYAREPIRCPVRVEGAVGRVWNGAYADGVLSIGANDGCIIELKGE